MSLRQLTLLLRQSLPGPQPPKKDTTSKLVVTPLGSLAFQYAEGVKGFNSQKGLFDVAIEGDATATAFKLTSRLITKHPDSAGYLWFHPERGR
ncbi:fimbrillin MatB [Klebsiella michiganensis]|uniref:Common pilus major fimbrillin subunit EcpA n=1 Tax=Klebsiella michiganensis TaxID=1134687 RepID=A0A7H4N6K2_9ENTR|nr:fimbrillin MatB [Klebsiella michiganensis]